jgi:hypothetical protein
MYEANHRMYVALGITDIDDVLPKPADPKPESPAAEHAKLLALTGTAPLKAFEEQDHATHIKTHIAFYHMPIVSGQPPVQAALLQHLFEHIHFQAKVQVMQSVQKGAQEGDQNSAQIAQMMQQDPEMQDPGLQKLIATTEATIMEQVMQQLAPPQQGGDPLVVLKTRELDIKEAALVGKQQIDQTKLEVDQQEAAKSMEQDDKELELKRQMHEDKMELETGKMDQARVDKTRDRELKIATTVSTQLHQTKEKDKDRKAKPAPGAKSDG